MANTGLKPGGPRSQGAIPQRRLPQPWSKDRRFRILSLDGGGIRGVFPATILAELEQRFGNGHSVGDYFDLIAGTSTGGILALGIGARIPAAELRDLYLERGREIFPEPKRSVTGRLKSLFRRSWHWLHYLYDREALVRALNDKLQDRLFGDSKSRLCIPAFDGKHSEVFVYKTPHHKDYKFDRYEKMITVALATSAAPTYFQPLKHGGYHLVDGGVWANNPVMLAVIEALICWDIRPEQIDVLSLGCGEDPYTVSSQQLNWSGKLFWGDAIFAAMRLQSMAATNQARLLLGPPAVIRILPKPHQPPIDLDDWRRAVEVLPADAMGAVASGAERISATFFATPVEPYEPVPPEPSQPAK
jgi:uncharacterized protein